jgi:hypothetical protein
MSSKVLIAALAASFLGGCVVERDASLYPLDDGAKHTGVIQAQLVGHGNLHGTMDAMLPDGEALKGQYSIVPRGSSGFGSIISAAGVATASGVSVSNDGQGSAVMYGDRGTTIQCEFYNNNMVGHGFGACHSSEGGTYKMIY